MLNINNIKNQSVPVFMNNKACMNWIKTDFSSFKFKLEKLIEPIIFSFSFGLLALSSKSMKLKAKKCWLYKTLYLQLHMTFHIFGQLKNQSFEHKLIIIFYLFRLSKDYDLYIGRLVFEGSRFQTVTSKLHCFLSSRYDNNYLDMT